ncbi:putative transcriptional regulator tpeD, partial [Primulina huaijiensis]|uniref:putative transcriptional regulator tpeD n=1 Tax=Primulina huaijiensis TaxID=1492673 RepID=UPI003CC79115
AAAPELHRVILSGGPSVKGLLPAARTVRNWLYRSFIERREDVKTSLSLARSNISLSFDIWSTSNDLQLLAVVGHWITKECRLQVALLGLRPILRHFGSTIAPVLYDVITTYGIEDRLGAFQTDNAGNNDTAIRELAALGLPIEEEETRMRCLGHTINLVVKAILFGEGMAAWEDKLRRVGDEDVFHLWREQAGVIGKLHNIVRYITRSSIRAKTFSDLQLEETSLRLLTDGGVRWNSTLQMIRRALMLKDAIVVYCCSWRKHSAKDYDLTKDMLIEEDWRELQQYGELLTPFELATKAVEGNAEHGAFGALWEVIPTLDTLYQHLNTSEAKAKDNVNYNDVYRSSIAAGQFKLQQAYDQLSRSRLPRAAVVLHPCLKHEYFKANWQNYNYPDGDGSRRTGGNEVKRAREAMTELFDQYLEALELTTQNEPEPEPELQGHNTIFSSVIRDYTKRKGGDKRSHMTTELERYLNDDLNTEKLVDNKPLQGYYLYRPLEWWQQRGSNQYPLLSKLAFNLFAIPAMSSEAERVFSHGKKMITDERYNLKADIIEADQCLKNWLLRGLVDGPITFIDIAEPNEPSCTTSDTAATHTDTESVPYGSTAARR